MDYFDGLKPHEVEAPRPERELPKELSLERAQGLIWKGFELSQGQNDVLQDMWRWIHIYYPHYSIAPEMVAKLKANLIPALDSLLVEGPKNPGIHGTSGPVGKYSHKTAEVGVNYNVNNFVRILNAPPSDVGQTTDQLVKRVFQSQVESDHKHIVISDGRPGDPLKKDIWESNICKFVFAAKPSSTGYQEYDEMWAAVRQYASNPQELNSPKYISEVIRSYNNHHPDNQILNPFEK